MQVDIFSDYICPWCFLGKHQWDMSREELSSYTPVVTWRPFQIAPDAPEGGYDRDSYYKERFPDKVKLTKITQELLLEAERVGVTLNLERIKKIPDTLKAHCLALWAHGQGVQDEIVTLLFEAYFQHNLDISDDMVLARLAGAAGMDEDLVLELLENKADCDRVHQMVFKAHQMGVRGVPCTLFNGRLAVMGAQSPQAYITAARNLASNDV